MPVLNPLQAGLLLLLLGIFGWFIQWLVKRFLEGIDNSVAALNKRITELERKFETRQTDQERILRKRIEDSELRFVKSLEDMTAQFHTELESFRAASAQEHETTRNIWHADLSRMNGEIGRLSMRQDGVEKDVAQTVIDLKEVTEEHRKTTDGLNKSIHSLELVIAALPEKIREVMRKERTV